jgi:hypothetical protein
MPILEPVEPQPPAEHIRHAGHHWLEVRDIDGYTFDLRVLQWNPVQKKWFQSGMIGSIARPVDTRYWKYLEPIPFPNI